MIRNYFVYLRQSDVTPVISIEKLPPFQLKSKLKWVGKKAKIEAIYRHSKVRLLSTLTTQQVNDYIAEKLFKTPLWHGYYEIFQNVASEVELVTEKFELKYTLQVELLDTVSLEILEDERLIHLITCELMGNPLSEFEGLINPIISLKKKYDNDGE